MIALPLTRGQRLWFVPLLPYHGEPRYVTVARTGTKWGYLDTYDGLRVDLETGEPDNGAGGVIGTLYTSKAEHARITSVRKAWAHLSEQVRLRAMFGRMPDGITYERIVKARQLLKLEAPP